MQVLTPKLYVEITHKTRVEVKLVRISNQAVTESVGFFFLPKDSKLPDIVLNKERLTRSEAEERFPTTISEVSSNLTVNYNGTRNIMINNKYT